MKLKKNVALGLCMVAFSLFYPTWSHADHIHAIVAGQAEIVNNDSSDCTPAGDICYLILSNPDGTAKTYGRIKVESSYPGGGPAKVEVGNDSLGDRIALKNAKITIVTGTGMPLTQSISFWALLSDPPTVSTTTPVTYELFATMNSAKRGGMGASGDIMKARGYVGFPTDPITWQQIKNLSGTQELSQTISAANFYFFPSSINLIGEVFPRAGQNTITGPRALKGEFEFKITQVQDVISIPSVINQGIFVRSQGALEGN